MSSSARDDALPVRTLDGSAFVDFEGFCLAFSRDVLGGAHEWRGNLDAFNDILRGGFGTPKGPWVLRWTHVSRSRAALAKPSPAQDETLFDTLVAILRDHGAGGAEEEDGVVLELEE